MFFPPTQHPNSSQITIFAETYNRRARTCASCEGFSEWPESYPRRVEFSTPSRLIPCDPSSGLLQTISSPARERTVKRRAYSFQSLRLSELAAFRAHSLKSLQLIELTAFKAYSFQSLQPSELTAFRACSVQLTAYRAYSL